MGVRDRGEFTSTVHGKPPELWLPSRLQRLRSRVLKITSYSTATHEYTHTNRLDPRSPPRVVSLSIRVCNRPRQSFLFEPVDLIARVSSFLPSFLPFPGIRGRGFETTRKRRGERREEVKTRGRNAAKREGKIWKDGGGWWENVILGTRGIDGGVRP